jgi:hypothetical protein
MLMGIVFNKNRKFVNYFWILLIPIGAIGETLSALACQKGCQSTESVLKRTKQAKVSILGVVSFIFLLVSQK